ncbi:MAG: quinate 5-dehydrogenase [Bacillota bacterium]
MFEERAVSISLGSPSRDYRRVIQGEGFRLVLQRVGTGGSLKSAGYLMRHFDGNCAAIGLGGVNLAYWTGSGRYPLAEGQWLAAIARYTPVVDGSGIKKHWEPGIIGRLETEHGVRWRGSRVLVLSALDRWNLAAALEGVGARLRVADPVVALGLPLSFSSLSRFEILAGLTLPFLSWLPLGSLYPNARPAGRRGLFDVFRPRGHVRRLLEWAQVIAGDLHFLTKILPGPLAGKTVLTSGLEPEQARSLLQQGAELVVSMDCTEQAGSMSANMLEAACVALAGRRLEELDAGARQDCFERLGLKACWWKAGT